MVYTPWLKVDCGIFEHPKLLRFARTLKITAETAVGHLVHLWIWGMRVFPDGVLVSADAADIADAAGWRGDPQEFIDALLHCGRNSAGFLEFDPDTDNYLFHDWADYGGSLLQRKKANAERQARYRERSKIAAEPPPAKAAITPPPMGALQAPSEAETVAEFEKIWPILPMAKRGKTAAREHYARSRIDYTNNQIVRGCTGFARAARDNPALATISAETFFRDEHWREYVTAP